MKLTRTEAREKIMVILYQIDFYKKENIEYNLEDVFHENLEMDNKYVKDIVNGVLENQDNIDETINKYLDNSYVFVTIAMGTDAKKVSLMYIEKNRSLVIETGHPSPVNTRTPFIGTDCFVRCNQLLLQNDLMPIQWVF